MTHRPLLAACLLALLLLVRPAAAAPRVLTSIEPLRDLAAALTAGVAEPRSLIPGNASPHHFALRPSQLASLRDADLVIWIDRHFESGFDDIAALAPAGAARLELSAALGLDPVDYHLWFSPRLLRASARRIVAALVAIDGANAEAYRANGAALEAALDARGERLRRGLRRDGPLLVTEHEFLGSFAAEFDLAGIVALHDQHDGAGSLGDLRRLERALGAGPASCLLTTEAAPSALAARLAQKYRLEVVSLQSDGLPDAPLRHLDRLLAALASCKRLR